MGGFTGKYSRNPFSDFNEEKNYAFALMQEGVPVTDDDENADRLQLFTRVRRGNQLFGDYGTPNNGFRIQEATSNVNNFKVVGGGPTNTDIEQAGRFFIRGIGCVLMHDVDYNNTLSDIAEQSIHPRITNVYFDGTDTVVEDSAANWGTNEIQGRSVKISTTTRTILSNGQDFFKISGDHTAGSADPDPILDLDYYILLLSTPGSAREDAVYLNAYIDEYDANDDPSIGKRVGGTEIVAQLRAKIIQTIYVRQDNPTWGTLGDYTDSNGNRHYVFKLATINRDTDSDIQQAEITDLVPSIGFDDVPASKLVQLRADSYSPDPTRVYVNPGNAQKLGGEGIIIFTGGTTSPFSACSTAAHKRWDLVYLNDSGSLQILEGAETTGTPSRPSSLIVQGSSIAYVYVEGTAVSISNSDILDARPFIAPDRQIEIWPVPVGELETGIQAIGLVTGRHYRLLSGTYTQTTSFVYSANRSILDGGESTHVTVSGVAYVNVTANDVLIRNIVWELHDSTQFVVSGTNVTFENVYFELFDSGTPNWMVRITGNNVRFHNSHFTQGSASATRWHGVYVDWQEAQNVVFDQCEFDGCGESAEVFLGQYLLTTKTHSTWTSEAQSLGRSDFGGSAQVIAQSFQLPTNGRLRKVRFFVKGAWPISTGFYFMSSIWSGASQPTTKLAEFRPYELPTTDYTGFTNGGWIEFPVPYLETKLSPGTTYWMVLARDPLISASGWVSFGGSPTSVYPDGKFMYYPVGGPWTDSTDIADAAMEIEFEGVPTDHISGGRMVNCRVDNGTYVDSNYDNRSKAAIKVMQPVRPDGQQATFTIEGCSIDAANFNGSTVGHQHAHEGRKGIHVSWGSGIHVLHNKIVGYQETTLNGYHAMDFGMVCPRWIFTQINYLDTPPDNYCAAHLNNIVVDGNVFEDYSHMKLVHAGGQWDDGDWQAKGVTFVNNCFFLKSVNSGRTGGFYDMFCGLQIEHMGDGGDITLADNSFVVSYPFTYGLSERDTISIRGNSPLQPSNLKILIHGNRFCRDNVGTLSYGSFINDSGSLGYDLLISHNIFNDPDFAAIRVDGWLHKGCSVVNNIIRNRVTHAYPGTAIEVSGSGVICSNNLIIASDVSMSYGIYVGGSDHVINNNLVRGSFSNYAIRMGTGSADSVVDGNRAESYLDSGTNTEGTNIFSAI